MEQIMNYVKQELVVVALVLYFVGMALKQSQTVKDKYIPLAKPIMGLGYFMQKLWLKNMAEGLNFQILKIQVGRR